MEAAETQTATETATLATKAVPGARMIAVPFASRDSGGNAGGGGSAGGSGDGARGGGGSPGGGGDGAMSTIRPGCTLSTSHAVIDSCALLLTRVVARCLTRGPESSSSNKTASAVCA